MEIWETSKLSNTMVPPSHQSNNYINCGFGEPKMQSPSRCDKRTARYGPANNPVSCTAYRAENGNLGKLDAVENNGTSFAPKECLYQKVDVGMETPKIQSLSRCDKRTGRYGPAITRFHATRMRPRMENWETLKLSKTVVPPLHQSNGYIKR